jgi:hypothetical protein
MYLSKKGCDYMYSGGTGTELDPWLIANVTDFKDIESNMDSDSYYFRQTADITLGNDFEPIGYNGGGDYVEFKAHYDGNNFKLKDATLTITNLPYLGIFRYNYGYIDNINLSNINITNGYSNSYNYTGLLCGYSNTKRITNCHADSGCSVSGYRHVGGLVGYSKSDIDKSSNRANVTGSSRIGGICGSINYTAEVNNCYNTGEIIASGSYAGGIVGNCETFAADHIGYIRYCYNTGNITCTDYGGGITGYHIGGSSESGYVKYCYALNASITRSSGAAIHFGRICGLKANDNNYALDTMQFIY